MKLQRLQALGWEIYFRTPLLLPVRWSAWLGFWGGRWKWTNFHSLNQAVFKGKSMAHVLIGKNCSRQVTHDLMHIDQNAPGLLRVKGNRFDVRIDLAPLLRPISANFFRPMDKTAFERFRLSPRPES
jgi:hypothetical protein